MPRVITQDPPASPASPAEASRRYRRLFMGYTAQRPVSRVKVAKVIRRLDAHQRRKDRLQEEAMAQAFIAGWRQA